MSVPAMILTEKLMSNVLILLNRIYILNHVKVRKLGKKVDTVRKKFQRKYLYQAKNDSP